MSQIQTIHFSSTQQASAILVKPNIDPKRALEQVKIGDYQAVIIMHSGAAGMTDDYLKQLSRLFTEGLVCFAEEHRVLIVDGGTEAGGMKLIGEARQAINGTFPLLGLPITKGITYPGGPEPEEGRWPLNAGHSHFLLVEADDFGEESDLLVSIADVHPVPRLALIVNGGGIVEKEAGMHAKRNTPLVTLKGSGRFADDLASQTPPSYPPGAVVKVFDTNQQSPQEFYNLLRGLLVPKRSIIARLLSIFFGKGRR